MSTEVTLIYESHPTADLADLASNQTTMFENEVIAEHQRKKKERERAEYLGVTDCECCGEPIPEKRKLAMPYTRYCVSCQAALDGE